MKNILEFLEYNESRYSDIKAFVDEHEELSWGDLLDASKRIGTELCKLGTNNEPIAVYLDRSVKLFPALFGVLYSGNYYVILDGEMPKEKVKRILFALSPAAVLTDDKHYRNALELETEIVIKMSTALKTEINEDKLLEIRRKDIYANTFSC